MHVHARTHMCTYIYAYTSDAEAVPHFQISTSGLPRKLHVAYNIMLFQETEMGHAPPRKSSAFLGGGWGWGTHTPRKSSAFPGGPMDFIGFSKDFMDFPMKFMGFPRKCVFPIDFIDFTKDVAAFLGGGGMGHLPPPRKTVLF